MAQFSVKTGYARQQADEENRMRRDLSGLEDEIRNISSNLKFRISAQAGIQARLRHMAEKLGVHQTEISMMYSALLGVIKHYESTEGRICAYSAGEGEWDKGGSEVSEANVQIGKEKLIDLQIETILEEIEKGNLPNSTLHRIEEIRKYISDVIEGYAGGGGTLIPLSDFIKGNLKDIESVIDKIEGNIKDKIKEGILEKTNFEVSAKKDGALYSDEIKNENGSVGVTAGAYSAYADASGGLFTEDEEGNLVFNPNIDAKMGASMTALTMEGIYALGNEMLRAAAEGHVTAGQVSAEVSAKASLRDSKGNINPHAKLDAEAELILIDAEAQAGVTVIGTEAKVKGSVNVGIGAHANVEVGDGKIKCDIGASLGIGASISLEIDFSGTIDAVQDTAESVFRNAGEILGKFKFW